VKIQNWLRLRVRVRVVRVMARDRVLCLSKVDERVCRRCVQEVDNSLRSRVSSSPLDLAAV
jgi:hypothetical protein